MSARIDFELNLLLVRILGADATPAIAMYDALRADNVKMNALEAAAKAALSSEQNRVFGAVLRLSLLVQKDRHRLAHWIWGRSPQLPNAILLADPRHLRARDIQLARRTSLASFLQSGAEPTPANIQKLFEPDRNNIFVYTRSELGRICGDMAEAITALTYFNYYLNPPPENLLAPTDDRLAQELRTSDGSLRLLYELRLFREALTPDTDPTDQSSNPQSQT